MMTPDHSHASPDPALPPEAEAWLQAHPDVSSAELAEVWRLAAYAQSFEPTCAPEPERVQAMQAQVLRAVRSEAGGTALRLVRPRLRRVHAAHVAVAAAVVLLLGLAWWLQPVVVEAPVAAWRTVALPDGSTVELNSGSRLSYRRTFGWQERRVELAGEAFFDVVAGEPRFAVHTFNSTVTVLGTRFNVRAWPGDEAPETVVVLAEGRVRFSAGQAEEAPVVLSPGQMSRVAGTAATPTAPVPVAVESRLAWRTGGMVFIDQPIGDLLNEVERRFGTRVEVRPASLRQERLSLILNEVSRAEEVVATIAATRGFTYQPTADGFVLVSP